jgi:3-isopropylmalate dehydrogenase
MASILSVAMMCDYWQMSLEASAIRLAVDKAIRLGYTTVDLKSPRSYKTAHVGEYITAQIPTILSVNHEHSNILVGKTTII